MKFYVEPTLETNHFKVALLHVDIKDILKNRSTPDIEKLILDIKMIIDKCKSFGVQKFIISGLIFNRKVEGSILEQVNYELLQLCFKNGYHFIENCCINNTVQMVHLYKDSLHLHNYGKDELANNFIDNIDSFLRENIFQMSDFWIECVKRKGLTIKTNHINSAKYDSDSDDSFDISSENQQSNNELDLEGLQKLRNQYRSNPLIGYLNINILQHKINSFREILKKSSLEIICVDETKLDDHHLSQTISLK